MAINKFSLVGATITATANNGALATITMQCLRGDIVIPMGDYAVAENTCHTVGKIYEKSQIPTFATIEMEIDLTGDKLDAERLFWIDAHQNLNDFTQANGDQTLSLAIAFADADANVFTFNTLVTSMDLNVNIETNHLTMITLQPTSTPVLT